MFQPYLLVGALLFVANGFGQPDTGQADPNANPNPGAYTPDTYSRAYNQPVEVTHGSGNWGLLGLLGLAGLAGRRRMTTMIRNRDEHVTDQRRDQYTTEQHRKAS